MMRKYQPILFDLTLPDITTVMTLDIFLLCLFALYNPILVINHLYIFLLTSIGFIILSLVILSIIAKRSYYGVEETTGSSDMKSTKARMRKKRKILLRYKPFFFDLNLNRLFLILYLCIAISAVVVSQDTLFVINHLNEYREISSSLIILPFIILTPHFITVGKEFKRMTGHFTWKPPEEYMDALEENPQNYTVSIFRWRF